MLTTILSIYKANNQFNNFYKIQSFYQNVLTFNDWTLPGSPTFLVFPTFPFNIQSSKHNKILADKYAYQFRSLGLCTCASFYWNVYSCQSPTEFLFSLQDLNPASFPGEAFLDCFQVELTIVTCVSPKFIYIVITAPKSLCMESTFVTLIPALKSQLLERAGTISMALWTGQWLVASWYSKNV